MAELDLKKIVFILLLILFTLGSAVGVATLTVRYLTKAQTPNPNAPGAANGSSFAPLPTAPAQPALLRAECDRRRGKRNIDPGFDPKYDLNHDNEINVADCLRL